MASVKKQVKKYIKKNKPNYRKLDREKRKLVKAAFEERVEDYTKQVKKEKKQKRRKRLLLICTPILCMKLLKFSDSKKGKKLKKKVFGK